MIEQQALPYLRKLGLTISIDEATAKRIKGELLIIHGRLLPGAYAAADWDLKVFYDAYQAIADVLVDGTTADDVLETMIPTMVNRFRLERKWNPYVSGFDTLKSLLAGPVAEWKGKRLLMSTALAHRGIDKKSKRKGKPMKQNQRYAAIDQALQKIAASRPRTQEEVFQALEGRRVAVPLAEPFKTDCGWMAGFSRGEATAWAWLSKRWGELDLDSLPRGPKNPKK